jgi:hypothetical protein
MSQRMEPTEGQQIKGDKTYHGQMDKPNHLKPRTGRNINVSKNRTHLAYTQTLHGK